jgi:hypothetical protein
MASRVGHRYGRAVLALKVMGIALALFLAYVVGRAAGILLGIGPYPTTALAVAAVLAWVAIRSRRT